MRYWILLILLLVSGCTLSNTPEALPTVAQANAVATGLVLTENAPPSGFDTVSFPRIDANLAALGGWRYKMIFGFNGVYARTPREIASNTEAIVTYNQVGSARRVVATIDDGLEDESEAINFEGVRLGPDVFLLREGICLPNAGNDAEVVADLSAGSLLGGVSEATTAARIERINGEEVWLYDFNYEQIVLPNVTFSEESRVLQMTGELWLAPQYNTVVRYYVNLEVENVFISGQTLPVTGTIIIQYDLYDVGLVPNISIPNGC
jgi:hypothetical protein